MATKSRRHEESFEFPAFVPSWLIDVSVLIQQINSMSRYVVTAASTPRMYAIDSIMPGMGSFALISYSRPTCP